MYIIITFGMVLVSFYAFLLVLFVLELFHHGHHSSSIDSVFFFLFYETKRGNECMDETTCMIGYSLSGLCIFLGCYCVVFGLLFLTDIRFVRYAEFN